MPTVRPMSRRALLALAAAGAAPRFAPPSWAYSPADEPLRLGELAARKGILYGSCVRNDMAPASADGVLTPYGQMMNRQCAVITCADMHWDTTEPTAGGYDFRAPDAVMAFAAATGKKVRGHALTWYGRAPSWFGSVGDRRTAIAAMTSHIQSVAGRYAGRIHSWDVVNEALRPDDGLEGGLRQSVFTDKIGVDWLHYAFRAARAADPKALLTYNDYGIEMTHTNDCDKRRASLLRLLDDFKRRGTPIDAVGIQSHLQYPNWRYFDDSAFSRFLADVAAYGVKIFLTELDTVDSGAPGEVAARDRIIAGLYQRYLSTALDNKAVTAVVHWGLSDREAWQLTDDLPIFKRSDGLPPRPLPFDADFQPKPAAHAIAAVLRSAPAR